MSKYHFGDIIEKPQNIASPSRVTAMVVGVVETVRRVGPTFYSWVIYEVLYLSSQGELLPRAGRIETVHWTTDEDKQWPA